MNGNNGLSLFQEAQCRVSRCLNAFEEGWVHWAYDSINYYDEEERLSPLLENGVIKSAAALAMPLFASLDLLKGSGRMIWHLCTLRPEDVLYDAFHCATSLSLFLVSFPLMPVAFHSPESLYRMPHQWEAIRAANLYLQGMEMEVEGIAKLERSLSRELFIQKIAELTAGIIKIAPCIKEPDRLIQAYNLLDKLKKWDYNEELQGTFLKAELALWVCDRSSKGRKSDAAKKIYDAFSSRAIDLNLMCLFLTSLPSCISRLTHLEELCLDGNLLKVLPEELSGLSNLERISLSSNRFISFPMVILKFSQLVELDLNSNWIASLPEEIGNLTQLKKLYIRSNKLTCTPSGFSQLTLLEELELGYNELKSVAREIFELKQLTVLSLKSNSIKFVPEEIGQLVKLSKLDLSDTGIVSLPPKIGNLINLKLLSLHDSKIDLLPPEITRLSRLKTINLSRTFPKNFPREISLLVQLKKLDFSGNKFNVFPKEIIQLSRLEELNLSENKLEIIPPEIFELTQLKRLYLDDNSIGSLPDEIWRLQQLETLNIADNPIIELPLSLGQIRSLAWLDTSMTEVRSEVVDAILIQCRNLRRADVINALPFKLLSWELKALSKFDFSRIEGLGEQEKILIYEWLVSLERTKDFRGKAQAVMARTVCQMLEDVSRNEEFRELFFPQVESNLTDCEDRAAMQLNEIYTSWKVTKLDEDAPIIEKVRLLVRGAKTLALRAAVARRIVQHQEKSSVTLLESVEIYLFYETRLRIPLGLLSLVEAMSYTEIGEAGWIKVEDLMDEVNRTYLDYLIELPAFDSIVDKDELYKKTYTEQIGPLVEKFQALSVLIPQEKDECSEVYVAWGHQLGELKEEISAMVSNLRKKWALEREI